MPELPGKRFAIRSAGAALAPMARYASDHVLHMSKAAYLG